MRLPTPTALLHHGCDLTFVRVHHFHHQTQSLPYTVSITHSMPTLKQISCSLELGSTNTKLKEYKHTYLDGGCEVYVAVPDTDIPFHIRVTSTGYIAPGLAAYVFIDGRYQCNRNRQGLSLPTDDTSPADYEVDFKLRQKEENTVGGLFVAREWSFAQLRAGTQGILLLGN
jgi:hypothetical protein